MGKVLKFEKPADFEFVNSITMRIEHLHNMVSFVEKASGGEFNPVSMTHADVEGMMGTIRRELGDIRDKLCDTL